MTEKRCSICEGHLFAGDKCKVEEMVLDARYFLLEKDALNSAGVVSTSALQKKFRIAYVNSKRLLVHLESVGAVVDLGDGLYEVSTSFDEWCAGKEIKGSWKKALFHQIMATGDGADRDKKGEWEKAWKELCKKRICDIADGYNEASAERKHREEFGYKATIIF